MNSRSAALVVVPWLLLGVARGDDEAPVRCLSGPSMKESIEELARIHERRTGVRVVVESNDPRSLISEIKVDKDADLFVSHDPFLAMLARDGIKVRTAWNAASLRPMIAVAKGNPKGIRGLKDLARPGVRVGLTDPNKAITGNIIALMLKKAGVEREVEANVVKRAASGRELASALAAGDLDAAFVWDAVVHAYRDKADGVDIGEDQRPARGSESVLSHPSLGRIELDHVRVTVALLEASRRADRARAFAEFVASPEGAAVFLKNGFSPVDPHRPPATVSPAS